jgi:hypothetical protein
MLLDTNTCAITETLDNTNISFEVTNNIQQPSEEATHREEISNRAINENKYKGLGQDPDNCTLSDLTKNEYLNRYSTLHY